MSRKHYVQVAACWLAAAPVLTSSLQGGASPTRFRIQPNPASSEEDAFRHSDMIWSTRHDASGQVDGYPLLFPVKKPFPVKMPSPQRQAVVDRNDFTEWRGAAPSRRVLALTHVSSPTPVPTWSALAAPDPSITASPTVFTPVDATASTVAAAAPVEVTPSFSTVILVCIPCLCILCCCFCCFSDEREGAGRNHRCKCNSFEGLCLCVAMGALVVLCWTQPSDAIYTNIVPFILVLVVTMLVSSLARWIFSSQANEAPDTEMPSHVEAQRGRPVGTERRPQSSGGCLTC